MTDIEDLPEFLDVWNGHFREHPCALTVVATKGLALLESKIEINIFGLRDAGKARKEIIAHPTSDHMRLGPAAVRAGDLLCLSALYAADENGALPQAVALRRACAISARRCSTRCAPFSAAAEEICRAGGTSLANVLRAHHFVSDLNVVYPALRIWQDKLPGTPLPFGAVRPPSMPIPGCDVILDAWFYRPGH